MKTAIVALYGLYSSTRTDYQAYLDFVASEIKTKKLEKVVLCGGFTDPKRPTESEASSVRAYLLTKNNSFLNYVLEDQSINTNQNFEFSKSEFSENDEVYVYCDLIRKAKIIWIALHYLLRTDQNEILEAFMRFVNSKHIYKDFHYKNITVVGFEIPGRSKEELIGQTYATILDVLSLYNSNVEKISLEQRKKDFGLL